MQMGLVETGVLVNSENLALSMPSALYYQERSARVPVMSPELMKWLAQVWEKPRTMCTQVLGSQILKYRIVLANGFQRPLYSSWLERTCKVMKQS